MNRENAHQSAGLTNVEYPIAVETQTAITARVRRKSIFVPSFVEKHTWKRDARSLPQMANV